MSYFDPFLIREDVLASKCDPESVPSLAEQARHKLPTKQHLPCRPDDVERIVDVRYLWREVDLSVAKTIAQDALERAEEAALATLRKLGRRPSCCARTGTSICSL